jgi:hypothetical protein
VSISVVARFSFNSKSVCCPENYRPLCNFLDAIALGERLSAAGEVVERSVILGRGMLLAMPRYNPQS